MSDIDALETASQPVAARAGNAAVAACAEPARGPTRKPAVQPTRPAGFGRRGPRMA